MPGGRLLVGLVPLLLVPALGAVDGGFSPDAWVWSGTIAAWLAALAALGTGGSALRSAWPWAAAAGALCAWTIGSALWSSRQTQTVLEARRTVVYVAVVLALLLLARRGATRTLVIATHLALAGLVVYALAYYLFGGRNTDAFQAYLLNEPVGYANGIGVLAALGALLGLGIASTAAAQRGRAAAAASVPAFALAIKLAQSRGSWVALAAGLAVAAVLETEPERLLRTAALLMPPCALLVWLGDASRLTDAVHRPWAHAGTIVALATIACCGVAGAAAAIGRRRQPRPWGKTRRRALVAVAALAAVTGLALVVHAGGTEPRASYWRVAWHDYRAHPVLGSGAGTFAYAWAESGLEGAQGGALDAHSLYLETLAELGPLGLALLAAFLVLPLRHVLAQRRLAFVPAAAGAYAVLLVHSALDWDWEQPVVIAAGLACGAAVLLAGVEPRPLGQRVRAAVLTAALLLGALAIAGARSHAQPSAIEPAATGPVTPTGPVA